MRYLSEWELLDFYTRKKKKNHCVLIMLIIKNVMKYISYWTTVFEEYNYISSDNEAHLLLYLYAKL